MTAIHEGGCLCGAVRYTVEGPLDSAGACHCAECRRWSGHFIVATSAPRERLLVTGELRWYESTPGKVRRGFCPVCGSSLFWARQGDDRIDIWAGTLDAPTGLQLSHHIWVSDKGDYYDVADDLPQHAREPEP